MAINQISSVALLKSAMAVSHSCRAFSSNDSLLKDLSSGASAFPQQLSWKVP